MSAETSPPRLTVFLATSASTSELHKGSPRSECRLSGCTCLNLTGRIRCMDLIQNTVSAFGSVHPLPKHIQFSHAAAASTSMAAVAAYTQLWIGCTRSKKQLSTDKGSQHLRISPKAQLQPKFLFWFK